MGEFAYFLFWQTPKVQAVQPCRATVRNSQAPVPRLDPTLKLRQGHGTHHVPVFLSISFLYSKETHFMANFIVITNNPLADEKYSSICQYNKCSVANIFTAVRDAVHAGAVLISHPLAGSLKPNENPYKTVVLSKTKGQVDPYSLSLIEGAVAVLNKMPVKNRSYSPQVLEDFMVIDLDLLNSAILALPAEYHW